MSGLSQVVQYRGFPQLSQGVKVTSFLIGVARRVDRMWVGHGLLVSSSPGHVVSEWRASCPPRLLNEGMHGYPKTPCLTRSVANGHLA